MSDRKKVFLGGTCNGSDWRDRLIPYLIIDYFNPVVEDWTEECIANEIKQREECDYCLYIITPKMEGVYSIAEVIDDSNKRPNKTIFCHLPHDNNRSFNVGQMKSLSQVANMVRANGAKSLNTLAEVAEYLNRAP